jgi:predicted HTH transcriptional regulator
MEKLNVPVNVPVNDRQKWFLKQIGKNIRVSSSDIASHWDVSQKTAKRDIADLKQKELIEFLGAQKNGYYRLKSSPFSVSLREKKKTIRVSVSGMLSVIWQ